MVLRDARDYQILFLSTFLLLGLSTRDWLLDPHRIAVAIAACVLTHGVIEGGRAVYRYYLSSENLEENATPSSPWATVLNIRSPLITSLSLSLLLRTGHDTTMLMAGGLAIASKSLFRTDGKHFFNPANFGIISAILLTHDAWVSPGQWGEDLWFVLLFAGAGGIVLNRVGRWDTSVTFLGTYAALMALRTFALGWTWDVWLHQLTNGSLLLFALFMITDPRSIPNARQGRVIWAMAIALLTFILQAYFFVSTAAFWALFVLAPCTLLIDRGWPSDRFSWNPVKRWMGTPAPAVHG